MTQTQPIIVFDSGIGGLSIYRPLKKALPLECIIYMSDPNNFPYGDKSDKWLLRRFVELAGEFNALNPKLLVLACNTATTNIIKELRSLVNYPVVGVEPVIKPLSKFEKSLVLMTKSSAKAVQTKELIKKYGQHVSVFTPNGLAQAIEINNIDQMKKNIHEIKKIAHKQQIQAIGLSCTHYPLIIEELRQVMPEIIFIDPSEAVVAQVQRMLKSKTDE